ncbi:MAG: putative peptidoglycan lytic transglycosylase (MltB), Glycoside Hydrolase Family 23 [Pseudomonadota bacterium]
MLLMYRALLACLALAGVTLASSRPALAADAPSAPAPATAQADTPARPAKDSKARSARKKTKPARPAAAAPGVPYRGREDALRFADEIAQRQGLDPAWTRAAIAQARLLPVVQRLMQPPAAGTRKNWALYRSRFIDPTRIAAGVRFWQEHRAALERAEQEYGVPAETIVGIIGVETIYGQQMGSFRVIDALATLSFDHPTSHPRATERSAYFRGELEQLLTLAHRAGSDPLAPLGSYAGAMGLPQFMPTSWVRWAVDFDGDGRIDLRRSVVDAIGSVASYFKGHGWQTGMPTHYPVRIEAGRTDLDTLLAPDILPTFSAASFTARGAGLEGPALQHTGPLALVELQNGDAPSSYVAGTENFYVITRYNQSSYYAMAVIELGREVKQARARQP